MYNGKPLLELTPEEVVDYLRKSRSDDPLLSVEEVLSKHEEMLDEWAVKNLGAPVPEENKFREVVSGETLKDRPEISRMLKLIESPKIKAVKVVEPQRLTRGDLEDIGRLMKLLKHTNTLVITPQRIYDLRDEYDWDAFERELKRGNDYLEYTKKILKRGRLLSVSQGNYVGSVAPYGYVKTEVADGKRKCPTLKINEDEANVVRTIFDLYANHDYGKWKIVKHLDELGIKPPKGKKWSVAGIASILDNIHYSGKVRWNHRRVVTIVEDSEFVKTRPVAKADEYLIFEGRHEAIVSDELFKAVQEKKKNNPHLKKSKTLRNSFAGILYCQCGRSMYMQRYLSKNGTEKASARLVCPDQSRCGTASCAYDELLNNVCEILKRCIEDFEIQITNDDEDRRRQHEENIKRLEARLAALERKEISQWEKYTEEAMPKAIFEKLNADVLAQKEKVTQALCDAKNAMPAPVDYIEKCARFKDALDVLKDPNASARKKNKLLKECIDRIEYFRERPKRNINKDGETGKFLEEGQWTNPPIELDVKLRV
jgi:hypothetical protein